MGGVEWGSRRLFYLIQEGKLLPYETIFARSRSSELLLLTTCVSKVLKVKVLGVGE